MQIAQNTASTGLSAMVALLNGGSIVIYTGTAPATPETAASGTTLVTLSMASTAGSTPAYDATSGMMVSTLAFSTSTFTPSASGTAGWARGYESDGTTAVADFTVGTSSADIILSSLDIVTTTNILPSGTMSMTAV